MKVKVLLLVVSIASLLAALICATGIIVQRGGPDAQGIIIGRGGSPMASGVIVIGPGPRA